MHVLQTNKQFICQPLVILVHIIVMFYFIRRTVSWVVGLLRIKFSSLFSVLDMDFRSIHPPSEQMALRSLDKWKSLSNVTSVNALVRTLKSIKKTEVAKKIEKHVLTVVN